MKLFEHQIVYTTSRKITSIFYLEMHSLKRWSAVSNMPHWPVGSTSLPHCITPVEGNVAIVSKIKPWLSHATCKQCAHSSNAPDISLAASEPPDSRRYSVFEPVTVIDIEDLGLACELVTRYRWACRLSMPAATYEKMHRTA